jgi:hypothetical protein
LLLSKSAVIPNAIHRLCFFHKFSQGWSSFVSKHIPDQHDAKATAQVARHWIATWFLQCETHYEYIYSRKQFFSWLISKNDILSQICVDKVQEFIIKKLDPYDAMTLNHVYLNVAGLNQRTTSIAESMHRAMKYGLCGVNPSLDAHVSANMMMNKAEQTQLKKARSNAKRIHKQRVYHVKQRWKSFQQGHDLHDLAPDIPPNFSFLTEYMEKLRKHSGKYESLIMW